LIDRTTMFKGRFPAGEPLLRGLAQADAYFRAGLTLSLVSGRHQSGDPSIVYIAHLGDGVLLTLPIASSSPPAITRATAASHVAPMADKVSRVVATILTNAGVAIDTPLALYPEVADLTGTWRFKTDPADTGTTAGWSRPDFDDQSWRSIDVPGFWAFQGVTEAPSKGGIGYDGTAWYRRTIAIPASWKDSPGPISLTLGGVADTGDVYWNGKLIAHGANRSYVKDEITTPLDEALIPYGGKATIAIKVVDNGPAGGLVGSVVLRKDDRWLTGTIPVTYGERYPGFAPDSYHYW
jgi:hypothetical protein